MNLRILVIDDDFSDDISDRLTMDQPEWVVDVTLGVRGADKMLQANRYDAVVIDMWMEPGLDQEQDSKFDISAIKPTEAGLAVLKMLDELDHRPAALVLTAHGVPPNIVKALQLGADAYLKKENMLQLSAQVLRAVERRKKFQNDPELPRLIERARAVQVQSQPAQETHGRVSIAGANLPAMHLSGDSYFFSDFSDGHTSRFILCDAAGHGPHAALVAGTLYSVFRLGIERNWSLNEIDEALHEATLRLTAENSNATGVLGEFNAQTNELVMVSAGHGPPVLAGENGAKEIQLPEDVFGMMWGPTGEDEPRTAPKLFKVTLPAQHSLLVYSDGVTDCFCQDEQYGLDRLIKSHGNCEGQNASEICEAIMFDALEFGGLISSFYDDMTVIAIHRS